MLAHQRLRFPWEGAPFRIKAEFATAQAVTPGQGQTVRVSGVRVGDITKVDLKDGRAVVTMDLDPGYKGFVHTDASALLRPKTGLKDMFIELDPGTGRAPRAKAGWTVPIRNTAPDVNPDEIFSVLDDDTRDYLKLLIGGAGQGLRRPRAATCATSSAASSPRTRTSSASTAPSPQRHRNLRRLVHSLGRAQRRARGQGRRARRARRTPPRRCSGRSPPSSRTSAARSGDLPGTLRQTTDTLGKVERFARVLRPTADDLRPPREGARPRQRAGRAARRGGDAASSASRSARSCATPARSCAR